MTEVETFDQASLEAFTAELVAASFEPSPDTNRRVWKGRRPPTAVLDHVDATTDPDRLRSIVDDADPAEGQSRSAWIRGCAPYEFDW